MSYAPLYSFDPETSGPGGGRGNMVMSIACAKWCCGQCVEWFRCDHQCHRGQGGRTTPSLADLNAAAERQFGEGEDGNLVYPPPGPAYTLTEGP